MAKTDQKNDHSPSAPPQLQLAGQSYPLRWDMRTLYRLQGLPNPPDLEKLFYDARRNIRTTLDLIWAALPDGTRYDTPEQLAATLGTGQRELAALTEALSALLASATPSEEKKSAPGS